VCIPVTIASAHSCVESFACAWTRRRASRSARPVHCRPPTWATRRSTLWCAQRGEGDDAPARHGATLWCPLPQAGSHSDGRCRRCTLFIDLTPVLGVCT
jgi:hypothetical protein